MEFDSKGELSIHTWIAHPADGFGALGVGERLQFLQNCWQYSQASKFPKEKAWQGSRVDRSKMETKRWREAYESMPRDSAKRILQGKPLAADGSLSEGTYAFCKGLYEKDG